MNKENWEKYFIDIGGDKTIIKFISDIIFHEKETESIRALFANGYCYYFALMLRDAFPGGDICVCYPYGHIVYIYDGVAYDIDGVSFAEYEIYIPIEELGDAINDFRHIEGVSYGITQQELNELGKRVEREKRYITVKSIQTENRN